MDMLCFILTSSILGVYQVSALVPLLFLFKREILCSVIRSYLFLYPEHIRLSEGPIALKKIVSLSRFINSDVLLFDPSNKVTLLASCCSKDQIQNISQELCNTLCTVFVVLQFVVINYTPACHIRCLTSG